MSDKLTATAELDKGYGRGADAATGFKLIIAEGLDARFSATLTIGQAATLAEGILNGLREHTDALAAKLAGAHATAVGMFDAAAVISGARDVMAQRAELAEVTDDLPFE